MLELGKCYELGKGTHQQLGKAIELYKAAHCWYNLGLLVEKFVKDKKKARILYKKALSREDDDVLKMQRVKAAYRLGTIMSKETEQNPQRLLEARRCFVVAGASEAILKIDKELERTTGHVPQDRNLPPPPSVKRFEPSSSLSSYQVSDGRKSSNTTTTSQVVKQDLPPVPKVHHRHGNCTDAVPTSGTTKVVDDLLIFGDDDGDDQTLEKTINDVSALVSQQTEQTHPQQEKPSLIANPSSHPLDTPLSVDDFYVDDDEMEAAFDQNFNFGDSSQVDHDTMHLSSSSASQQEEYHTGEGSPSDSVNICPIDLSKFPRQANCQTVAQIQQCMKHLSEHALKHNNQVQQEVEMFATFIESSPEIEVLTAVADNNFSHLRTLATQFVSYTFSERPSDEVVDRILNSFVILIQMNKNCAQALSMSAGFSHMCYDLLTEGVHQNSEEKMQLALVTIFETFSLDSLPSRAHIDESNRKTLTMILSTLISSFERLPQPLGTLDILSLVPFLGGEVPRPLCSLSAFAQGYLTSLNDSLCKAHIRFIEFLPRNVLRQMFSLNDIRNVLDMCERQARDRPENDDMHHDLARFVDELKQIAHEWT